MEAPGPPKAGRARRLAFYLIASSILPLPAAAPGPDGRPEAEAEWLDLSFRPPVLVLHPGETAADAVAHLTLANPGSRAVRVAGARIAYFDQQRALRVDVQGESFFRERAGARASKLDRGGRAEWRGICLDAVPDGADRVRIELELVARMGPAPRRVRQSVEAPLRRATASASLHLPFEGTWQVSQGHACHTDHRLGGYGADFAWDFVAVDSRTGRSVHEPFPTSRRNRDTVSFGKPVLAPAAGRVVRIEAEVSDNDALRDYPARTLVDDLAQPLWNFGNHIVMDLGEGGPYLLVAHLRQGSIRVATGSVLRAGDTIAQVGNSGRSVYPHLHVQMMDRADPADRAVTGIPARFRDYVELTSRSVSGARDSVMRRITDGDPLEGSIVIPAGAARE